MFFHFYPLFFFHIWIYSVLSFVIHNEDQPYVSHYEPIQNLKWKQLAPSTQDTPYGELIQVEFQAFGQLFASKYEIKRDLYASNLEIHLQNKKTSNKLKHIAYKALPKSFSNDSFQFGRLTMIEPNHFHALFKINNELYLVDSKKSHEDQFSILQRRQLDVKDSSTKINPNMIMYRYSDRLATKETHQIRRLAYGRMNSCSWKTQEMQIGVVSDAGHTNKLGGESQTQTHMTSIFNRINALYEDQIGVHLTIGHLNILKSPGNQAWNEIPRRRDGSGGNGCGRMKDMENQLDQFRFWASSNQNPICANGKECGLWHLFTNCNEDVYNDSNTIGLAYVGVVCRASAGYNTGISAFYRSQSWEVAAHELGHNFGSHHTFRQGGIMSYNPYTERKFVDNGQICSHVSQSLNEGCLETYKGHQITPTTKQPNPIQPTTKPTVFSDPCKCTTRTIQCYLLDSNWCYVQDPQKCTHAYSSSVCRGEKYIQKSISSTINQCTTMENALCRNDPGNSHFCTCQCNHGYHFDKDFQRCIKRKSYRSYTLQHGWFSIDNPKSPIKPSI